MTNLNRRQKTILSVLSLVHFCNGICVSLQAPFYPQEATEKGCSATEYGLVIGIYELTIFLTCPFYGKYLNRIGTKKAFNGGVYTTSICVILFGCLGSINGHYEFITLSFIMRILEGAGYASFLTASSSIIVKEFSENVGTTFAFMETCFGLGNLLGPTVGGALYAMGGYVTPFAVMGSVLLLSAIITTIMLPQTSNNYYDSCSSGNASPSILKALKIPALILTSSSIVVTSLSIGFLQATLEPHLRRFDLNPVVLGLMFIINGATYAVVSPLIGWLCDRKCKPKLIIVFGTVFISVAFSLLGPAPYLPIETTIATTVAGLIFHGLGIASQLVPTFTDALRTTLGHGFPNNIETFGLITGLWRSSFALGAFSGPSISGLLYDSIGFRYSSLFVIVTQLIVGICMVSYLTCDHVRKPDYIEISDEGDNPNIVRSSNIKLANGCGDMSARRLLMSNGTNHHQHQSFDENSVKVLSSYNQCLGPYGHGYGSGHFTS